MPNRRFSLETVAQSLKDKQRLPTIKGMQSLTTPLINRLAVYCRERFPLPTFGLMSSLFAVAGLSLASSLRSGHVELHLAPTISAVVVTLGLFFQLRILDEYKDRENDALYLPERPVPRGLISLNELFHLGGAIGILQLAICLYAETSAGFFPLLALLATWFYMYLMTREFFAAEYLKEHPLLYMLSHMFIMLFIDFFITSFDFGKSGQIPPLLIFFYAASFFNGMAVELGRKIFAPLNQRAGIVSYSHLLGLKPAFLVLFVVILLSQLCLTLTGAVGPLKISIFAFFDFLFAFATLRALNKLGSQSQSLIIEKTSSALANLAVLVGYLLITFN